MAEERDADLAELERRVAESLARRGLPPTPAYGRVGAHTPPDEVLAASLAAAIEEAKTLNRARAVLPATLARFWIFRIGFVRRAALRLLGALSEDQRRINAALIRIAELEAERKRHE